MLILKKIKTLFKRKCFAFAQIALSFLLFPYISQAATANPFVQKIAQNIVNPLIKIFFAIALAFFMLGVIRFVAGGSNEDVRQKGRDHILWGLVGMGIMLAAFAIVRLVIGTFGISDEPLQKFGR